jgi:hypothetical protein
MPLTSTLIAILLVVVAIGYVGWIAATLRAARSNSAASAPHPSEGQESTHPAADERPLADVQATPKGQVVGERAERKRA